MINLLKPTEIAKMDKNQLMSIDFFEKKYPLICLLSLFEHKKYNPIEIVVKEQEKYQVFMSCKGHKGAYYLCSFENLEKFNRENILSRAEHYLKLLPMDEELIIQ